jgi:DNA-binding transcriptional ArsR family regulator
MVRCPDATVAVELSPLVGSRPPALLAGMTNMVSGNALAQTGALLGDPARANILLALMDGRALTAGELAWHAGVSPQTTSAHLARLVEARLVSLVRHGRHRYHRLASPEVAAAIEAVAALAAVAPPRYRPTGPRDEALRTARTCYDHLAGRLGVAIAAGPVRHGYLDMRELEGVGGLTDAGAAHLAIALGIGLGCMAGRRPLCRICLDWTERRPHLGGRLGAALHARTLELGWIAPLPHTRALAITAAGRAGFADLLGVGLDGESPVQDAR